jgi:hypothetical protein
VNVFVVNNIDIHQLNLGPFRGFFFGLEINLNFIFSIILAIKVKYFVLFF